MTNPALPVAVVSGGARRLGRHLAEVLAKRGYHIVILYRTSAEEANYVVTLIESTGGSARAIQADIGVHRDVESVFQDIAGTEGRVDLLINNVGNYNPQDVTLLEPAAWDATIAANLSGAYYCCYHAVALMPEGGQIISIGMAGLEGIRANKRGADYYVSKTGLLVLTRSLAAGYAKRKIRVNMVSPGQLENSIDLPPPDKLAQVVPLGRAGTLQDISQAMEYLLDATYVTGVNIDVSGGYRL
jgi:3-oxoacyl-[acyl-carrier protein] reductase